MFDFFKKKKAPKTPLIEIWTQYGGLENIDLVRPSWGFQKSHLPDWWKAGPSMLAPANASMFEKTKACNYCYSNDGINDKKFKTNSCRG